MSRVIFSATAFMFLLSLSPAIAGDQVIRIPAQDEAVAWAVGMGASVEDWDRQSDFLRLRAPEGMTEKLFQKGAAFEVLIDDVQELAKAATILQKSTPPSQDVDLDHYLSFEEMQIFLFELQRQFPNLVALSQAGTTTLGKPLYLVKISDNAWENEDEPEVFFEGQIHGDELAGSMLSLHMIEYLVTQYGVDDDATHIVDNTETFFLPATNTDSAFANFPIRYNANGVDMNRDCGYMWHANGGSKAPFGEAETQTLFSVWQNHSFVFQTSWHAGTLAMSLPWSYFDIPPPDADEYDFLGRGYCEVNDMIDDWFAGSQGMYVMHGSTKDSAYGAFGTLAWTIELSNIKQIPWATAEQVNEANRPSIIWVLEQAGKGLTGTITDAQSGEPVAAVIDIDNRLPFYNDPDLGDLHRFLLPGVYDMTIWANGFAPRRLEGVSVPEDGGVDISTALEPDPDVGAWAVRWLYNFSSNDRQSTLMTKYTLGPPDGLFYSIGHAQVVWRGELAAHAVLDLGPQGIEDGAGFDLYIYEGGDDGDELIDVFAATQAIPDQWTYLGSGAGDCHFDLRGAGLDRIRYVKIVDKHPAISFWEARETDGYDLDAVGTPNYAVEPIGDDDSDDGDDDADMPIIPLSEGDDDDDDGCGC